MDIKETMKNLDEIFKWSTVKRTVAFEQNGWFVYYSHNNHGDGMKVPFISHGCLENDGGWRVEDCCQECDEPVPESIKTIYILLQWSEQGYVNTV